MSLSTGTVVFEDATLKAVELVAETMTLNNFSVSTAMSLQQATNTGNVTTNTVQFTNPTTAFVTTGNVGVGGELTVSGNVEVGTANLFVDTTTGNVGIGTASPITNFDIQGSLLLTGIMLNVEIMENMIQGWGPTYWWDVTDDNLIEGGATDGSDITHVHSKSSRNDNFLTATTGTNGCIAKWINGRRFWTGKTINSYFSVSGAATAIGDDTAVFAVACVSPNGMTNSSGYNMYYYDTTNTSRTALSWDSWGSSIDGKELSRYNGTSYGYDDGSTGTAGGILGTGPTDTTRHVHAVFSKMNSSFPSARRTATESKGISNLLGLCSLTKGNLTTNLANVVSDGGTNTNNNIYWGTRHTADRHNPGEQFFAEIIFFRNIGFRLSYNQVRILQEYFRFKYSPQYNSYTGGLTYTS